MRFMVMVTLLALATLASPAAAQDRGVWPFEARPYRVVPFPYVPRYGAAPITVPTTTVTGSYRRRSGPLPWRYDPEPDCQPPTCLPSYYRPAYPRLRRAAPAVPLANVLQRLKRLDYTAYGPVSVDRGNYRIEALDRHDQAVVVVVSAKTGQVRRVIR